MISGHDGNRLEGRCRHPLHWLATFIKTILSNRCVHRVLIHNWDTNASCWPALAMTADTVITVNDQVRFKTKYRHSWKKSFRSVYWIILHTGHEFTTHMHPNDEFIICHAQYLSVWHTVKLDPSSRITLILLYEYAPYSAILTGPKGVIMCLVLLDHRDLFSDRSADNHCTLKFWLCWSVSEHHARNHSTYAHIVDVWFVHEQKIPQMIPSFSQDRHDFKKRTNNKFYV